MLRMSHITWDFPLQSAALFSAADRPPFTLRVFGSWAHRCEQLFCVTAPSYQAKTSISTGLENNITEGAQRFLSASSSSSASTASQSLGRWLRPWVFHLVLSSLTTMLPTS